MKKEQYIELELALYKELRRISKELSDLEKTYIEANQEFKKGEKVVVKTETGKEYIAFIRNIHNRSGKLIYSFFDCKKDGTCSARRLLILDFVNSISKFN